MVVYMEPVAQGRPRFGNGRAYDPKKSSDFKKQLALAVKSQYIGEPLKGALMLSVKVYIKKPKSVKREMPTVKPDLSNYIKGIEDALNGILWEDDSHIVEYFETGKYYSETPRIEIKTIELG